ncbi:tryptophan synthase subunit alpha [Telmatocola sphagniphila]|uniref:Tryptophan synthase alpha chain n=1 Tax=Telmatocola sphagniphila TaxID=1123043 RepID=A0A8E6B7L2_9BACT|nr:tryptophan synthase subunit alpha [Telmatocola sphagniphila]QVL33372.1 tryptophan synthase subunit alpha [Telmatocola sphagniphila]
MNPIDSLFQELKKSQRKAFIPFITAGDPNLEITGKLILSLAGSGADIIEIGFPFSDPVADGPVIQASYTRALSHGLKIDEILKTVHEVTSNSAHKLPPIVGMVSYSIIHRKNTEKFLLHCKASGLSGLIVPDMPVEETESIAALARQIDLKLILLVTPTTSDERIQKIGQISSGFLYCVSLVGITGERAELPETIKEYLSKLRRLTTLPLCVGFGVSRKEQVQMLRDEVDGVIVGSAIVRLMEKIDPHNSGPGIKAVSEVVMELSQALNGPH